MKERSVAAIRREALAAIQLQMLLSAGQCRSNRRELRCGLRTMLRKTIKNLTEHALTVTLLVRQREDVRQNAGQIVVNLTPKEERPVEYASLVDIYLNGLIIEGDIGQGPVKQEYIIRQRGALLDDMLNQRSVIMIREHDRQLGFDTAHDAYHRAFRF